MRIVLDTNALLVSLPASSKYHPVFQAFVHKRYTLFISNDIYLEYLEIITQKASPIVAESFIELLFRQQNIEVVDIYYQWNLITADADDNKFSDCAIAAKADYLVTNDAHFNVLKNLGFPKINIITLQEFLTLVESL